MTTLQQNNWSIFGKTCLVTGATRGIGYLTALDLVVKRGARRVILACRNVDLANKSAEKIRQQLSTNNNNNDGQQKIAVVECDLASLTSVRQCARQILQNEPELHVLICNAGMQQAPEQRQVTEDGFEVTFQTNYLGHFLLVNLLLPLLQRSAPSRVVLVASDSYMLCWPNGLDVDDLNLKKPGSYSATLAYCQSKLAEILFARQLHSRLKDDNIADVAVFALHPGFGRSTMPPDLLMTTPPDQLQQLLLQRCSASLLYCACESDIDRQYSGCYFSDSAPEQGWHVWQITQDDVKAQRLWQLSERWTLSTTTTTTISNDDNDEK